ncbi:MAG TPA: hypothetical protein VJ866_02675 [Pyrinomonadaceae bacterium]|nr:hypothetical protein [Pyrinomonadaceae bacterium]
MGTAIFVVIGLVGLGCLIASIFYKTYTHASLEELGKKTTVKAEDVNRAKAWQERTNAEANTQKNIAQKAKYDSQVELIHAPEMAENRHQVAQATHVATMDNFRTAELGRANERMRIEEATNEKTTPAIREWKQQVSFQTDEELRKVTTIEEHKVEMDFRRQMNTIRAILAYQHLNFDQFDEVRNRLVTLIGEEAKIEAQNLPPHIRGEHLRLLEEAKDMYREVFNDFKNRLRKNRNGSSDGGNREVSSVLGRPRGIAEPSVENELPLDPTGDWLREGFTEAGRERTPPHLRNDERGKE